MQTILRRLTRWAWVAILPLSIAPAADASELATRIDALLNQPRFASAHWGIVIDSLDSGRTLYSHDADRLAEPASTAKLFTAALTLENLDTSYRIPTRVLAAESFPQGRLHGPLMLYGMGDPSLGADLTSRDWADQLASQLAARGLHRVDGPLIADDSYFTGPAYGSGWEVADLISWFAVPSSALSVNENIAHLQVAPGARMGAPARLSFDPPEVSLPLQGGLQTSAASSSADLNLYRMPGQSLLHVFGSVPLKSPPKEFKLGLADPAEQAGRLLLAALNRHGITVGAGLRTHHWPEPAALDAHQAQTLAQVVSPPLGELLKRGLKRSQNLYLQNLLQLSGVKAEADAKAAGSVTGFASSADWGIVAMHQLLKRIGLPADAVQLEEGTGLSRRDLVTPRALNRLLVYMASRPYAETLRADLPLAGVDGSLQYRLRSGAAANNLHAKTGSMSFVHCLAGYLTTAAGEHLAFTLMLNDYAPPPDAPPPNKDIDAIVQLLASRSQRD